MARGLYPHELNDPDFQWLLNNFFEEDRNFVMVTEQSVPVTLICVDRPTGNPMKDETVQDFLSQPTDTSGLEFFRRKPS